MRKILVFIGILVIIGLICWFFVKGSTDKRKLNTVINIFKIYISNKGRYQINIPSNWDKYESTESGKFTARTVWQISQSGVSLGNISQISVTVIASPAAGQELSTQNEFDDWYKKKDGEQATNSSVIKVKNEEISGIKAVRLKEEAILADDEPNSFFSQTSWLRKDKVNYYINVMGNGLLTDKEKALFEEIKSSFKPY